MCSRPQYRCPQIQAKRGSTVNLASRLASVAQAGDVVVSEEAVQRAEGFIFQDVGPATLKGVAAPMRLFRVAR